MIHGRRSRPWGRSKTEKLEDRKITAWPWLRHHRGLILSLNFSVIRTSRSALLLRSAAASRMVKCGQPTFVSMMKTSRVDQPPRKQLGTIVLH
jgi:hypothetical protein